MWRSLIGYYDVEITCGVPLDILTKLNNSDIYIQNVRIVDELHVCLEIGRIDMTSAALIVKKYGGTIKILEKKGIYWRCLQILERPALVFGFGAVIFLTLFLSTRVLFVNVVGNEKLSANYILERAELCGIRFGSLRREVRSEVVKNRLLEELPELRWAGVNTAGCVATVIVKEREAAGESNRECGVGKIVAERDGIIGKMVVKKGTALCGVGQAVKTGQTLVSGYTDTGLGIKAELPIADIFATTQRELYAVTPLLSGARTDAKTNLTYFQIRIGKKLINFCNDSGILGVGCVKMYSSKDLVLPGGFVLPIALIKVNVIDYDIVEQKQDNLESFAWLSSYAEEYIINQMRFGKILDKQDMLSLFDGCAVSIGRYLCDELIGQVQNEEIVAENGKR